MTDLASDGQGSRSPQPALLQPDQSKVDCKTQITLKLPVTSHCPRHTSPLWSIAIKISPVGQCEDRAQRQTCMPRKGLYSEELCPPICAMALFHSMVSGHGPEKKKNLA
jgi:hypothetical protein